MSHKLILNKGGEEHIHEFGDIEDAFNTAISWIVQGYIARITDNQGVVKYTQTLMNGQIATYLGDVTVQAAGSTTPTSGQLPTAEPKKRWWRYW